MIIGLVNLKCLKRDNDMKRILEKKNEMNCKKKKKTILLFKKQLNSIINQSQLHISINKVRSKDRWLKLCLLFSFMFCFSPLNCKFQTVRMIHYYIIDKHNTVIFTNY